MTETNTNEPWHPLSIREDQSRIDAYDELHDDAPGWLRPSLWEWLEPAFVHTRLRTVRGARASRDVEVKWGVHPAGEGREEWVTDEQQTTLLLLVSGRFRIDLSVGSFVLENEGDYALWGPGIDHHWQAEKDTVVVTVRWPSGSDT